jgi:large subunit ribosomal protein L19
MNQQVANQKGINISPVNMENRREIGIRAGDTVRVWQKIEEKGKTRLQAFEGLVLSRKHGNEAGATFTVRRVSGGIGVEKIFPLYSPMIDKIEIVKRSKVRRSKLYHIREKVAREIRRQMRKMHMVEMSTGSDNEEKANAIKVAEEAKIAEDEKSAEDFHVQEVENKEEVVTEEAKESEEKAEEAENTEEPKK